MPLEKLWDLLDFIIPEKSKNQFTDKAFAIISPLFVLVCSIFSDLWNVLGAFTLVYIVISVLTLYLLFISIKRGLIILRQRKEELSLDKSIKEKQAVADIETKQQYQMDSNKLEIESHKKCQKLMVKMNNCSSIEDKLKICKDIKIYLPFFPEEKEKLFKNLVNQLIGENANQDQKSIFYTIFENFEPHRGSVNKLLCNNVIEAIKQQKISKRAVEFLMKLTDGDLDILKKQFKYIIKNGIMKCDDIVETMKNENLWHNGGYSMRFFNEIWQNQDMGISNVMFSVALNAVNINDNLSIIYHSKDSQLVNDILYSTAKVKNLLRVDTFQKNNYNIMPVNRGYGESKFLKLNFVTSHNINGDVNFEFDYFVVLSDIGKEIYDLISVELEEPPASYLDSVLKYVKTKYPNYTFCFD